MSVVVHGLKSPRLRNRRRSRSYSPVDPRLDRGVDRDYWVEHSDGFRVDGAGGRIGFVERIQADPENPGGVLLMVRAGVLGLRVVAVRSTDVTAIVPQAQRIWLHSRSGQDCV
jgi:hypothetical protein